MFNRILVAIADDEIVDQVSHTASAVAETLSAHLAFVHVAAVPDTATGFAPIGIGAAPLVTQDVVAQQEEAGRMLLGRVAERLSPGAAEIILRTGTPAAHIAAVAREWQADLIVIGTHGRSGLGHLLLGSVAEEVLREAPCPVLTLGPEAARQQRRREGID